MGKRTQFGICHICGSSGPLSFEHVPPESAFNNLPAVRVSGERILGETLDSLPSIKGPISQRGVGAHTLCPDCNSRTGAWYGSAYADWAYQGFVLMDHAQKAPSLYHIFHLFPLRVIKQIFCMFFSRNQTTFRESNQDLVRFVLNKDQKCVAPSLQVFAYFNAAPMSRHAPISGVIKLGEGTHIFSEVTFPPFGYILTVDGKPLDDRLVDISFFSRFSYNDWTDIALRLPVFTPHTGMAGDFRSREEFLRDRS
jgi:hypothetical protein